MKLNILDFYMGAIKNRNSKEYLHEYSKKNKLRTDA